MMLTIDDLRNEKRKSGFDHVNSAGRSKDHPAGGKAQSIWRAESGRIAQKGVQGGWRGPSRKISEEAAQDYCDYINNNEVQQVLTLNKAGHGSLRDSLERDEEVEAALGVLRDHKAQKAGRQGYVYLIGVEGDSTGVKLGYSVKPAARVGELQTGNHRLLKLLGYFEGTAADEKAIHARYIEHNLIGEWFSPTQEMLNEFGLEDIDPYTTTMKEEFV